MMLDLHPSLDLHCKKKLYAVATHCGMLHRLPATAVSFSNPVAVGNPSVVFVLLLHQRAAVVLLLQ